MFKKLINKGIELVDFMCVNIKYLYYILAFYSAVIISFDLFIFKIRTDVFKDNLIVIIFGGLSLWFGIQLVIRVQMMNTYFKTCALDFVIVFVFSMLLIANLLQLFVYFTNGNSITCFLYAISLLSVIKTQKLRKLRTQKQNNRKTLK